MCTWGACYLPKESSASKYYLVDFFVDFFQNWLVWKDNHIRNRGRVKTFIGNEVPWKTGMLVFPNSPTYGVAKPSTPKELWPSILRSVKRTHYAQALLSKPCRSRNGCSIGNMPNVNNWSTFELKLNACQAFAQVCFSW